MTASFTLFSGAIILHSWAINYGNGAVSIAFAELNPVWLTVILSFMKRKIPSPLAIGAIAVCMVSCFILACDNDDTDDADKDKEEGKHDQGDEEIESV